MSRRVPDEFVIQELKTQMALELVNVIPFVVKRDERGDRVSSITLDVDLFRHDAFVDKLGKFRIDGDASVFCDDGKEDCHVE